jgi:mRNA deadenylase 3'-5' endonuclease subunit Ccr4
VLGFRDNLWSLSYRDKKVVGVFISVTMTATIKKVQIADQEMPDDISHHPRRLQEQLHETQSRRTPQIETRQMTAKHILLV